MRVGRSQESHSDSVNAVSSPPNDQAHLPPPRWAGVRCSAWFGVLTQGTPTAHADESLVPLRVYA